MDSQPRFITKYHVIFDVAVLALAIVAAVEALDFPRLARTFPLAASSLATIVALMVLAIDVRSYARAVPAIVAATPAVDSVDQAEADDVSPRRVLVVSLWMLGYVAGIWVVGLPAATIVYLMSSLLLQGKVRLWAAALMTAVLLGWLLVLAELLGLRMPPSLIDPFEILPGNLISF
jgi:hypothetical protein